MKVLIDEITAFILKMAKKSAGILMSRFRGDILEVFPVHPGGPFWAKKDRAAWSIPKGEFEDDEDPFQVARREFETDSNHKAQIGRYRNFKKIIA